MGPRQTLRKWTGVFVGPWSPLLPPRASFRHGWLTRCTVGARQAPRRHLNAVKPRLRSAFTPRAAGVPPLHTRDGWLLGSSRGGRSETARLQAVR